MEAALESGSRLALSFATEAELADFVERARAEAGFVVALDTALDLYARLTVRLAAGGETRCELTAEVAQVFAAGGERRTAFLLDPAALVLEEARTGGAGEVQGTSPMFQIKQMNVSQKARLASRASRTERQILLRDNSAQVLQGLLTNPRLELKEVLQIVKSTHANAPILQRIAGDARWGKNPEILATVARNPKTPVPFATRLIDKLRTSDLRLMAKMQSGTRETIRRAALREYLRRTSAR